MLAGDDVGYVAGCVHTLLRIQAAKQVLKDRDVQLLQTMQAMLSELQDIDPGQSAWQDCLERLQAKFKRLAASLRRAESLLHRDSSTLTF
jgi:hypothetical protein